MTRMEYKYGVQYIYNTSALTLSEGLVSGVALLPVSRVLKIQTSEFY